MRHFFNNPPPKLMERLLIAWGVAVLLFVLGLAGAGAGFLFALNGGTQ